jgi:ATP-binding cassette subfamily B protein RaxB
VDAPDTDRVRSSAVAPQIHGDIKAMPMGYQTVVGTAGGPLSGGQKQRLLLARALYRGPKVLLMDEGTAHLDVATERAVNKAIAQLGITRILIAHRPETLAAAPRIVVLEDGRLVACSAAGDPSAGGASAPDCGPGEENHDSRAAATPRDGRHDSDG